MTNASDQQHLPGTDIDVEASDLDTNVATEDEVSLDYLVFVTCHEVKQKPAIIEKMYPRQM